MGEAVRRCLGQLADTVGDVAYNIVFLRALPGRQADHWHADIWPKATTTAGFELGTGVAINVVSPEEAADTLKVPALAARVGRSEGAKCGGSERTSSKTATRLRTTSRSVPASPLIPGVVR